MDMKFSWYLILLSLGVFGIAEAQGSFLEIKNIRTLPTRIDLRAPQAILNINSNITGAYGVRSAKATIYRDKVIVNSFPLFDDGTHMDGGPKDETWGNQIDVSKLKIGKYDISIEAVGPKGKATKTVSGSLELFMSEEKAVSDSKNKGDGAEKINDRIEYEKKAKEQSQDEYAALESEIDAKIKEGKVAHGSILKTVREALSDALSFVTQSKYITKDPKKIAAAKKYAKKLIINGPSSEKLDILFLGHGFSETNLAEIVSKSYDFSFKAYSPFAENSSKLNIWILPIEKVGAKPKTDIIDSLLDAVKEARNLNPQIDKVVFLSKDRFRPFAFFNGDSFVSYAWVSKDIERLGSLIMHEFGHSFGGLADEYVEPALGALPREPNCLKAVPQKWADARNTIHTSFGQDGLTTNPVRDQAGCSYVIENSRPTLSSVMATSGSDPYGAINEDRLLERLMPYSPKEGLTIFHPEKNGYVFAGENLIIRWQTEAKGVNAISATNIETGMRIDIMGSDPDYNEKYLRWDVPPDVPTGKYKLEIVASTPKSSGSLIFNFIKNKALKGLCVSLDKDPIGDFFNVDKGTLTVKNKELEYKGSKFLFMLPKSSRDLYIVKEEFGGTKRIETYLDNTVDNLYHNYHNLNGIRVANIVTGTETKYRTGKVSKITNLIPDCPDFSLPFQITSPTKGANLPLNSTQTITWEDGDLENHTYEIVVRGKAEEIALGEVIGKDSFNWSIKEPFVIGETYTLSITRDDKKEVSVSIKVVDEHMNLILTGLCSSQAGPSGSYLVTQAGTAQIKGTKLNLSENISALKPNADINLYLLNYPSGTLNTILIGALVGDEKLNPIYEKEGVKIATITTGDLDSATDGGTIVSISQSPSCDSSKGAVSSSDKLKSTSLIDSVDPNDEGFKKRDSSIFLKRP